jgi:hypothetical protein
MDQRASATMRYLVDFKSILLAIAIFDFVVIWMMVSEIRFTCIVVPRYQMWSYLTAPTILLVASIFLTANRWWGNTAAFIATGGFIGYFIYILSVDPVVAFRSRGELTQIYYPYFIGFHYLFAVIIFCYAALSLKKFFPWSQKANLPAP